MSWPWNGRGGNGEADDLGEGFTFDSVRPYKRIDYVWLDPRLDLADEEGALGLYRTRRQTTCRWWCV